MSAPLTDVELTELEVWDALLRLIANARRAEELEKALREVAEVYCDNNLDAQHHGFDAAIEDARAALAGKNVP